VTRKVKSQVWLTVAEPLRLITKQPGEGVWMEVRATR
jgi:hypothetical protein